MIPIERLNYLHSRILQGYYLRGLFAPGEGIVTSVRLHGCADPKRRPTIRSSGRVPSLRRRHRRRHRRCHPHCRLELRLPDTDRANTVAHSERAVPCAATGHVLRTELSLLVNEYYFVRISPLLTKIWDVCFGGSYLIARPFLLAEIFRALF